jgi:hypothetical protein
LQRKKTDREIKNGHFRERKPMGKSRIDISEKENRWGNQEWTFQREKTDREIKNGHFRERKPMGKSLDFPIGFLSLKCPFLISLSVFFL